MKVPLKHVVDLNQEALSDATDSDFEFHYVDVGAVSEGRIELPTAATKFGEAPSRARRLGHAGDTIVSTVRTYLRAIAAVPEVDAQLVFSTGFAVLHPQNGVDTRYLNYSCRSIPFVQQVEARSVGVSYPAINPADLLGIEIDLPQLDEQRRIADYLDAETARIDALISSRIRQRDKLATRLLALTANELIGDGGQTTQFPWLPLIDSRAKTPPVYAIFDVLLGKMINPERVRGSRQRPYLRNANVSWGAISVHDVATMHFSESEASRYQLQRGDLMVCEGGAGVAEAAVWDGSTEMYYQKSLHRVRQRSDVPVVWLRYWLQLIKSVGVLDAQGNLATIPHLTGEQLRELRLVVPDDVEAICARLTRAERETSGTRRQLERSIDLLRERRRALITAAVTGELEIPGAAA